MIKPKKYVWGSSALPRVFLGILVQVLESTLSDRPVKVMALCSCFLMPNN